MIVDIGKRWPLFWATGSVCFALAACATNDSTEASADEPPVSNPLAGTVPGDREHDGTYKDPNVVVTPQDGDTHSHELESAQDPHDPASVAEEGASASPCGASHIASVAAKNGNKISFCDLGSGAVGISEMGRLETPLWEATGSALPKQYGCAADIFEKVAEGELQVPARLVELCTSDEVKRRGSEQAAPGRARKTQRIGDQGEPSSPAFFSHFCNSSGRDNFEEEMCSPSPYENESPEFFYRRVVWCYSNLYTWHQLTASTQLDTRVDIGEEILASCQGRTRHTLVDLGTSVSRPISDWHATVEAGYWHRWEWVLSDFEAERDMRFIGEQIDSDAVHRFTGAFVDWVFP
ncbi:MAG: hypothetical protein ACOY0T_35950 [Myxococcota bacterium]